MNVEVQANACSKAERQATVIFVDTVVCRDAATTRFRLCFLARCQSPAGWDVFGNEVKSDVILL
jgi:hypothetical protein